ncbi:PepSY-associated TM helix domain-containing protein [Shewanella sp.]|uniref:PepSY-associated TM helix domain-containing protein n=1 Tax=Shewanella sp. TaxID=50422 RepID=UPI003F331C41
MRKLLWKWHGLAGLLTALPLFVIALSGSLLVFKNELDNLLLPKVVQASTSDRLSLTELLPKVNSALPSHEVLGWEFGDAGQADTLFVAAHGSYDWQKLWLDPASGELLTVPKSLTWTLTDWLLQLHSELLMGHLGLLIAGLTALFMLFLGGSGIVLHRQFWRTFLTLRWRKSLRLLLSDSHKMLGIVSVPLFLVLGFTGAWWNLEHFYEEVIKEHDESAFTITQRYYNSQIDLEAMMATAKTALPGFTPSYLRLPDASYPGLHLFGHQNGDSPLRSRFSSIVSFNDKTGEHTATITAANAPLSYQFTDSFKPLHYGDVGGIATRIIWCVVGFFPCLMALSGFFMWRERTQRRNNKITY